uniref:Uncharacterized protein n=1 Tax=Oryza barthii TaxID=65489 RepID=A0A0D3F3F3_9ORYZ
MAIPIELSEHDSLVKSASTVLNSKVVCQYSSLLSQLAIDATLALVDPAHPDLLDLRSRGGPDWRHPIRRGYCWRPHWQKPGSSPLPLRRVRLWPRRLWAPRGRARQLMGEVREVEVRLTALDVERGDVVRTRGHLGGGEGAQPDARLLPRRKGDEDGNGDSMREENVKGDWSGMVPILEIFSGI